MITIIISMLLSSINIKNKQKNSIIKCVHFVPKPAVKNYIFYYLFV